MKRWAAAAIGLGLLAVGTAMVDQALTFAPREEGIPWGSAILTGIGCSAVAWLRWRGRRRRIGRELSTGDYVLAVTGAPGVRYTVGFDDVTPVIWRSMDNTGGDPWYTSAHRSYGEPAGLDLILYDEDGMPVREWFYLASWIRSDRALDEIMVAAGRRPNALNLRILLDIGESTVRLVVYPGVQPPPRNDDWAADPNFLKGGTTVWLGRRDESGRWEGVRQGT